ncbi:MAG: biotin--[acetyl-CoA-carboxylase] ligase [Alphaproteobacteria bacterium]|nr:biotin--[acetyl-CoA-carboxylase] ligase [Alphaproteobacteria bacterium]
MIWNNEHHKYLASTQDSLKERLDKEDLQEGFCILTHNQTNGYGRHGRTWENGEGNLFFSFLLKPDCPSQNIAQLSLIAGLALHQTIQSFVKDVIVKWPNDITIADKKCAGILIEIQDSFAIIGIGVNLKSAPQKTFTYLENHIEKTVDPELFLQDFQNHFLKVYLQWKEEGFVNIREDWLKRSYDKGKPISVRIGENKITGTFETIDTQGNLVLICDETNQRKTITSGDVFPIKKEEHALSD